MCSYRHFMESKPSGTKDYHDKLLGMRDAWLCLGTQQVNETYSWQANR